MSFNRIRVSEETSMKLRLLKARTGLTPNISCRLAFVLSLNEPGVPKADDHNEIGQEFNRYTLTGEWDQLFIALLKERMIRDGLNPTLDLFPQFRAHLNRGVSLLQNRVKTLTDLINILPTAGRSSEPEMPNDL